jgi:hypothetical protein
MASFITITGKAGRATTLGIRVRQTSVPWLCFAGLWVARERSE